MTQLVLGNIAVIKKDRTWQLQCTGKPVLKCLRHHDETVPTFYFIGCTGWNIIDLLALKKMIHFHPPPPNRVPITIRACLQELTRQANTDNVDVTPTRIITAILWTKLDKERITTVFVHQKYNIPKQGHDKGLISRNVMSNKRSGKLILLCQIQSAHSGPSKKINEDDDKENNETLKFNELDADLDKLGIVFLGMILEVNLKMATSQGTVNKVWVIYKTWSCVIDPFRENQVLLIKILEELIKEKVDLFLDELVYEMAQRTGKIVSVPTLWRSLSDFDKIFSII
ncbi:hypothetical protein C1645_827675 [Glomus cerebriforme]|uniref:Uncharacterized protein n=1 Tax=Glomus cerebriforme TaxID=658196 RepID=A0A397SX89_9GLOM|nr:hypothetical protein C1645_827675 [Glomus cerebriforme]